jgi:membrane protease YdiL (CAAX protease family)
MLWAFWHLPKYLSPDNSASFLLGSAKIIAEAVLYTWLYNNTRGSLLMTSLMHSLGNTVGVFLPMAGTISGSNTGTLVIVVALEVLAAIVVTVVAGPANLSRTEEKRIQE